MAEPTNPQPNATPAHQPASQIHRIAGWRRVILWPFAVLVRLWNRSLRFEIDPESLAIYSRMDRPIAFILWHNRLFIAAEIIRRYRNGRSAYALVSASKDGAWLEVFFSMAGLRCVRGSSSRLGREAASALIDLVKEGKDIGITPDGPRGPCYDFKPGALVVARRSHANVLLMGMEFHSAWHLTSWDRFTLPLPFSRVTIKAQLIQAEEISGDRDEAAAALRQRLLAINPDPHP
ncbi:MAG: lysophospholipid acyltransferase family protein [Opitutaceae bacterium]|jgi:hypothetical protein